MRESGGREKEKDAVHELRTKQGHEGNRKGREQGRVAVIEHVNSWSSKAKHEEKRGYGLELCATHWRETRGRRRMVG